MGEARMRLFSIISTFDTAQDVTADELRIETFFPADEDSAALLRSMASRATNRYHADHNRQ
ncbi:MAG: hypothetical protein L0H29_04825 [Sinobacteraceae bacterium]|nr:hypothetical protein [Nevskiaceae bacterium]